MATVLAEARSPEQPGVVLQYVKSGARDAQTAVCLDCETVLGAAPGTVGGNVTYWSPGTLAELHRQSTGHRHVYPARFHFTQEGG